MSSSTERSSVTVYVSSKISPGKTVPKGMAKWLMSRTSGLASTLRMLLCRPEPTATKTRVTKPANTRLPKRLRHTRPVAKAREPRANPRPSPMAIFLSNDVLIGFMLCDMGIIRLPAAILNQRCWCSKSRRKVLRKQSVPGRSGAACRRPGRQPARLRVCSVPGSKSLPALPSLLAMGELERDYLAAPVPPLQTMERNPRRGRCSLLRHQSPPHRLSLRWLNSRCHLIVLRPEQSRPAYCWPFHRSPPLLTSLPRRQTGRGLG